MGSKFEFRCDTCGYTAEVSGGPDAGFYVLVETMVCNDCKELVDVLIGGKPQPAGDPKKVTPRCPICHDSDVSPWDTRNRPCPKCGSSMEQGEVTVMWD
jgi:Zn finger protein HypA/HybF involved in hydrogenase expression